jgi:hypothetical protein
MKLASLAGDKTIVRAKPYNARAKPIEGIFGVLETHHFAKLPGWVGGNRMKSKTANIGRARSFPRHVRTVSRRDQRRRRALP